jgi:cytochrome c oxidase assembly protein subunit 15
VRLTGSGLGCPTWPDCTEGSLVPTPEQVESALHRSIEFGNRLLTFVLTALAIAAAVGALTVRLRQRSTGRALPRRVLPLAFIPIVGTVVQAVLGGITVLTGLHPAIVGAHFLVSIVIIGGVCALVHRAAAPIHAARLPAPVRLLTALLLIATFAVVVLGVLVTGSGPHSGDSDVTHRLPFDVRTIAWMHADAVLFFLGLLAGTLIALHLVSAPKRTKAVTWTLAGVSVAQGVVGYVQFFTGVPWLLVLVHVAGAVLTWTLACFVYLVVRGPSAHERVHSHREEQQGEIRDRSVEQPHRADVLST